MTRSEKLAAWGLGAFMAALVAPIAVFFMWLWMATGSPPPIFAEELSKTHYMGEIGSRFDQVIKQQFPIGSSEASLLSMFKAQGFNIVERQPDSQLAAFVGPYGVDAHAKQAQYNWGQVICSYYLTVSWTTDEAGKIQSIDGGGGSACL